MPAVVAARLRKLFASRQVLGVWVVVGAMLLAAVLAVVGLDNQLFWDDEANTAIYGRNLLEGRGLTAWDGTNLVGYNYGGALGEDLGQELRVPALPAYVAALGMGIFGQTTFGGRIMFVVAGVLSVGLLAVWLRRHLGRRFPWWLPSLLLALSPAFLLYIRNCRYYALGVMFTLLVWVFWAPGSSRGRLLHGSLFDRRSLLRYAGGAAAIVLLMLAHYLNAVAALVTLPLFLMDRRYRQPKQYVLLGVICAAAAVCGVWILATANPFAAEYQLPEDSRFVIGGELDRWPHFYMNLWWFLRDLGTHEFFPWLLVPVFLLPWLPVRRGHLRPLARRGWILVAIVLLYAVLAAGLTPPDMGKGPFAEMRYVVPLIALGSAVGGMAVVMLWRSARALAPLAFLLLVVTNILHLGILVKRVDGTSAWWPPTLYRYVGELLNDYRTGNEEMIGLMQELPDGTTVRMVPGMMAYPPMFYARKLHYCDQLTKTKNICADLRSALPDYLFVERARPDVILVAPIFLHAVLEDLDEADVLDSYQLRRTLPPYWNYTSKPEIPTRFFSRPAPFYLGMVVLVLKESTPAGCAALQDEPVDAAAHHRLGLILAGSGQLDRAAEHYDAALRLDPAYATEYIKLANAFAQNGQIEEATLYYAVVLRWDPDRQSEYLTLANVHMLQHTPWLAEPYYRAILQVDAENALKIEPGRASTHFYLAEVLAAAGKTDKAIDQYREALRLAPKDSKLAGQIEETLRRLDQRQQ